MTSPLVSSNTFIRMPREDREPPRLDAVRHLLPVPHWEGHERAVDCYWKVWDLAFRNIRRPTAENGFVANYIDTAFNDNLFMWDSAFILLFARYAVKAFDFQRTLDNLYCKQYADGFICREIRESDGCDAWHRFDPSATGPNVMPWTEWEYWLATGDRDRLSRVFIPLAAFHRWMRAYRTWPDGTYWANGLSCGMDNQPRMPADEDRAHYHGHLSWIDTCFQQVFAAGLLGRMAAILGRDGDAADFREEHARLSAFINKSMWDGSKAFYFDRRPDGGLTGVKTVGAYWGLAAGAVPADRVGPFTAHLANRAEFDRPHRVPTLAADHGDYHADGGYWLGAVWPPTNYMVMYGLRKYGMDPLAHEIALNHHDMVVRVFGKTGTVHENYAPESANPGNPAKADFVGWGGLGPTAVLFEHVMGIQPDVPAGKLVWDVRLIDAHGVTGYPFGNKGVVDLSCAGRSRAEDRPEVRIRASCPLSVVVRWDGGTETVKAG